jgi:PAS domain S-box-containing protein
MFEVAREAPVYFFCMHGSVITERAPKSPAGARPDTGHVVQFYENDAFLVDQMARFIGGGLGAGDRTIVIATEPHRRELERHLTARGLDVRAAGRSGAYVALDAAATLSRFMVGAGPDPARFADVVGDVIARASRGDGRPVRAFGEMVSLLWTDGRRDAAIHLEQLWNTLAREHPMSLLCAYPMAAFGDDDAGPLLSRICGEHTHVVPAESYSALEDSDERLRAITALQQKARVLETEASQRRHVEQELRERDGMLRALVAASPLPIVVIEPDATTRLWNPAAERVFGWPEVEVIGTEVPMVPPDRLDECARIREAVAGGDSVVGIETQRLRRDGSTIAVRISAAPLLDVAGSVRSIVLVFEDVTARNQAEEARHTIERRARAEAEAASRAKDEFLAMLGHELRNPLSAVRNAVATARLDASRRDRALDIASRGVDQLGRLVDDLLDIARITHGRIGLRTQRLVVDHVVERAVEATRPLVDERAHALSVSLAGPHLLVDGDATRLEQVVANLISNAAKYTEPGGHIAVQVTHAGGEVVIGVRDDGIGISAHMLPRVFDLFAQAERSLARLQGGLGIGLTIVKRLVELHGGRVEARSSGLGMGSEFAVRLPAVVAVAGAHDRDKAATSSPNDDRGEGTRVLLVEDNLDAADSLSALLEVMGHRVRVAHDGPRALEIARTRRPDLMLVDIGLPGMDGYEVARAVRREPRLREVVLVALTGYGREEDRERALAAGFDRHLVKPVEPGTLRELVGHLPVTPAPATNVAG